MSIISELYSIHKIYQRNWRDISSQARTEMKLKEEHYFRRETDKVTDGSYFCFCGRLACKFGLITPADRLVGQKINCYKCRKEFTFSGEKFSITLKCGECK